MKILSGKEQKKFNDQFIDLQLDYNQAKEDEAKYMAQIDFLREKNTELGNELDKLSVELLNKKAEIKILKTLLTKNKIEYKKGDSKCQKPKKK